MQLKLYPMLSTNSKRAIRKTHKGYGRTYHYRPRGTLLERLAQETGLSVDAVHAQLLEERKYLTKS